MSTALYWPYDEVTLKAGSGPTEFLVQAPWLGTAATLREDQVPRALALVGKFENHTVEPRDLPELNWFFSGLSKFPLCYSLPRAAWSYTDTFQAQDRSLLAATPREFLALVADDSENVARGPLFDGDWKWDAEGALRFATSAQGIDPQSLFTVARRFHLLSAMESNTTADLYSRVRAEKENLASFNWACALMVRQNHYVTERCNASLAPALDTAQSARPKVEAFMAEEYGHDRILKAALLTIVKDPASVPVTQQSRVLMDLLAFSARRNFLSFALIVDFFERSPYQQSDPLAQVLSDGGLTAAARHINRHHEINDSGEHENVALGFLEAMGPVTADFAIEAMRIAEATTNVMNLVATGVDETWRSTPPPAWLKG